LTSISPSSRRCAALQLEKANAARTPAATRRFLRRWLRAGLVLLCEVLDFGVDVVVVVVLLFMDASSRGSLSRH
jgi:hypothetical protein